MGTDGKTWQACDLPWPRGRAFLVPNPVHRASQRLRGLLPQAGSLVWHSRPRYSPSLLAKSPDALLGAECCWEARAWQRAGSTYCLFPLLAVGGLSPCFPQPVPATANLLPVALPGKEPFQAEQTARGVSFQAILLPSLALAPFPWNPSWWHYRSQNSLGNLQNTCLASSAPDCIP